VLRISQRWQFREFSGEIVLGTYNLARPRTRLGVGHPNVFANDSKEQEEQPEPQPKEYLVGAATANPPPALIRYSKEFSGLDR
jgi:hypothetical protein